MILTSGFYDQGIYAPPPCPAGTTKAAAMRTGPMTGPTSVDALNAPGMDWLSLFSTEQEPTPLPMRLDISKGATAIGRVSTHDAVLRQAVRQESERHEPPPAKLAWLHDYDQMSANRRPSRRNGSVGEAIDKLLTTACL